MKKRILLCIGLQCCALLLVAQSIWYELEAPNALHHEARITLTVKDLPEHLHIFRMSRSSPGRYATHEFGKNVYNVSASNEKGQPLACIKTDADVYTVGKHNGTVVLQYTLFANHADGTYASVDVTGYHLNMPAVFMWIPGLEQAPITLSLPKLPAQWTVATQLYPTSQPFVFTAPNLQYFMDSPIKAGPLRYRSWQLPATGNATAQTIRIAFDTDASDAALDVFTSAVQKIVAEAGAVFGGYPSFANGMYTFLASLHPWAQGDGMEHLNSTMISMPTRGDNIGNALGTFAHEFFHAWNVERIRPATLEPFAFDKSNMSDALWLAEGFTQYYGELIELRSGLTNEFDWLQSMGNYINGKQNRPGGKWHSVADNSQLAVFTDAGTAIDKTNFHNIFSSYYITGAATALALDLSLRSKFQLSLDDYMQLLWQRHGLTETPYSLSDLEKALAILTKDAGFAQDFFSNYVTGTSKFDYHLALQQAGWQLQLMAPGEAWVGNQLREIDGKLQVGSPTLKGTPLYDAGLDAGDEIVAIDEIPMKKWAQWSSYLKSKKPGDTLSVVFKHRLRELSTRLVLGENPEWQVVSMPRYNSKAEKFRQEWLNPRSK